MHTMHTVSANALEAAIGLGWGSPDTSIPLTSIYLVTAAAVATVGLLRLRRVESGGVSLVLVGYAFTALFGAYIGGRLGSGMFEAIALLSWGVFAVAPMLFMGIALVRRHQRPLFVGGSAAAVATLAIGFHAFMLEPHWLEVTHIEHRSPKVERGLTIALLADLQTDAPGDYERGVLAEIAAARPDLVLWAGDYLQIDDPADYARATETLRAMIQEAGIDPALGMFAVQGNSETRASWPRLFDETNVVPVPASGRIVLAQDVTLTALGLRDSFDSELRIEPAEGLHIVLGHAPDYALGTVDADLLLAGHTHGGQVRLPWLGPILTLSQVPRAWAAGTTRLENGGTLVVSRGVGMERGPAPRLRFSCRPELVFIHVRPE